MDGFKFQARRGFRLDPPGQSHGVSCDADGPAMEPIRLLIKTATGFAPRPVDELSVSLSRVFERAIDAAGLMSGLRTVARALNEGDMARAMIATTQMRLPFLSEAEAKRAEGEAALRKASPDDPKHPGWPAGAPDGRGGEFRPKEAVAERAGKIVKEEARRLAARRLVREAVLRIISPQRATRLMGEVASNAIPLLDIVGDVALAADVATISADFATLKRDSAAAMEFIDKAPYGLESLRVDPQDKTFSSYEQFKKVDPSKFYGPTESGYQYHHIVEQSQEGSFTTSEINSTANVIKIPRLLHEAISGAYSQKDPKTEMSLRQKLQGMSYEEHRQAGLKVLRDLGIIE